MGNKKPGFTLEQHDQLGLELQTIFDRMGAIKADLGVCYPRSGKDGKAYQRMAKVIDYINDIRSEMDEFAFNEFSHIQDLDTKKLYYRALRDDHITHPKPIHPYPEE